MHICSFFERGIVVVEKAWKENTSVNNNNKQVHKRSTIQSRKTVVHTIFPMYIRNDGSGRQMPSILLDEIGSIQHIQGPEKKTTCSITNTIHLRHVEETFSFLYQFLYTIKLFKQYHYYINLIH